MKRKNLVTFVGVTVLSVGTLAGCGKTAPSSTSKTGDSKSAFTVTMMTAGGSLTHAAANSPLWQQLEKLTNANIQVQWIDDSNYDSKVSVELASGNPPAIMRLIHLNSDVTDAAQSGAFWDLGPYLKDYKYLNKINPIIYDNIKINGQIYGIPAVRPLARFGIIYRKDWLKNLGLTPPKTMDQFYNMLYDFTYKDPDKDGKNDTYGMVVSQDTFPFTELEGAFDVPFNYSVKNGKLTPAQETPQYIQALQYFQKLYKNKLINQNFSELPVNNWSQDFLNGKAGVIVGTADDAKGYVQQEPSLKGKIGVLGPLKGPDGTTHDYDTGGNDGMFVIPKSTVKTVADLKKVLSFMNAMCSPDVENLLVYGVKNQNYKLVNGYAVPINTNNTKDTAQLNDLEELSPLLQSSETLTAKPTPLDKEVDNVENVVDMKYLLTDPTASLNSKTEAQDGTQLTNLLNTAMMKFIAGQTDVSGIQAANQQWLKDGGQKVISELEAAYAKYK